MVQRESITKHRVIVAICIAASVCFPARDALAAGLFVAVGDGVIATSTDGAQWQSRQVPAPPNSYRAVLWGGGLFVAVGLDGAFATSPDGLSWTGRSVGGSGWHFGSIAYKAPTFVAISGCGTATSSDGVGWDYHSYTFGTSCGTISMVSANNSIFVATGGTTGAQTAYTSTDGVSWSPHAMTDARWFYAAPWTGTEFAAVGSYVCPPPTGGECGAAYTSNDGVYWYGETIPNGWYGGAAWNGSRLVAVGRNVAASANDGSQWDGLTIPSGIYRGVAWNGAVFAAVGDGGVLATSADGLTWPNPQPRPTLPSGNYFGIASGGVSPTVSSLYPTSGPMSGGTRTTITGAGFAPGVTVSFGGALGTDVLLQGGSSLSVTVPPHALGVVNVVVINPNGLSDSLGGAYTFVANPLPPAPPALSTLTPAVGTMAGGTVTTLTGSDFQAGAHVSFDGVPASDVTVVDGTTIRATTPAHAEGIVDVQVANPDGQTTTLPASFTYTSSPAPVVLSATPSNGVQSGGARVTLSGTGFASGLTVDFGGVPATGVSFVDSTKISAVAPPHAEGDVDLVVTNPDGQSGKLASGFHYVRSPPSGCGYGSSASQASLWVLALSIPVLRRRARAPRER